MGNRNSRSRVVLVTCVTGALAIASAFTVFLHRRSDEASQDVAQMEYANPSECASCHAEIAATYKLTGMGRSFSPMSAAGREEDFSVHNVLQHPATKRIYTMTNRDGKFYESRQDIGDNNTDTEAYEKSIDYVIGSGNHARTYLHRTSEGKLVELPISWYSEMGGAWGMSPGYDSASQKDFRRAIGRDCMFCHNGYPSLEPGTEFPAQDPIFAENLPEGIDCQRCHGPGAAHVKAARTAGIELSAVRSAILNPTTLSRDRQMNICMQCHLETTSLRLPNSIKRFERATSSYRPGEPLEDYMLYFDHKSGTGYDERVEVAHQAYRLAKSACFLKSQMTCTTCHNPHQALRGEEAKARYISVCVKCHTTIHPKVAKSEDPITTKSDCLTCHMWKRRTDDVIHLVMTDHYIQRIKPKRDMLAPLKETVPVYRGQVIGYYPRPFEQSKDAELYLATAQVANESDLATGIPRLRKDLEQLKPTEAGFYFALASAYSKDGESVEAIRWFDQALQYQPNSPSILREYADALTNTGDLTQAAKLGEKSAALPNPDTASLTNLGNNYLRLGRVQDAERVLRRALAIDPDLADANNLLGLVLLQKKDTSGAEQALRTAIQIQPELAEAQNNLGTLLAELGNERGAESHIRRAIEANRSYAEAHRSYAMLLASTRAFAKAALEMKEAVRLQPGSAAFHYDFAEILLADGKVADAELEYKRSLELDSSYAEAYLGLGNILNVRGQTAQAENQFREAIRLKPQYDEAHLALGDLLARRGAIAEAREQYGLAAQSKDPTIRQSALKSLRQPDSR